MSDPAASPEKDKATNRTHRKSPARDGRFYEEKQALHAASIGTVSPTTSVCITPHPTHPSHTPTTTSGKIGKTTTASPTPTTKPRTRCLPWHAGTKDQLTPVNFHTPALWRDLSYPGVIQELADEVFITGAAVAITARLRHDIEAAALSKPSTITWLQQRIALQLREAVAAGLLSKVPEHLLVLEQIRGRSTHLHGLIEAPEDELGALRKAFRLGCGEYDVSKARQHQVKTDAEPDDGWTSYLLKDRAKTLKIIRALKLKAGDAMSVTFNGKPYTATLELRRRAKARYEADRVRYRP